MAVKNYDLGKRGVNVDKPLIEQAPGELLKAQNAIIDPLNSDGGLKNRPGLVKFTVPLAGTCWGGIAVPIFNYVDTRTLYLAQHDGTTEKWYSSSNLFVSGTQATAIGAWQDPTDFYSLGAQVSRMGVFFNGQLYYASANYTMGTTSPTIRVFNGSDDRELCKVLPATTKGITGLFACKGLMYVTTLDSGTTDADFVGRCFRLSQNGHLDKIGTAFATGYVPQVVTVYNNSIYVACNRLTTTNEARIYRLNLFTDSTWTLDATMDADDYQITGFAVFKGLLYCTTKNGGGATKGKIKQRSIAGVWSTVDSTLNNTGTYEDITVFGGALYASSKSYSTTTNTAVIRKSTTGSSWSTVYNATATLGVGLLNVIGLRIFSMSGAGLLHSLTGSSWTAATPPGANNCDGALGVLLASGAAEWADPVDAAETVVPTVNNISQAVGDTFDNLWLRKRQAYFAVAGVVVEQIGLGTLGVTGPTANGNAMSDSLYIQYNSAGPINTPMGFVTTSNPSVRLSFLPRFQVRVATYNVNQTEYLWVLGVGAQTSLPLVDTLTAAGIVFRYHHPSGAAAADSGNWYICVNDGTSQVDTDTGMAVQGGTVAGNHVYTMEWEVTSLTTLAYTIADVTAGTSVSGEVAISGAFSSSVLMGPMMGGRDLTGAVHIILFSKMFLDTN